MGSVGEAHLLQYTNKRLFARTTQILMSNNYRHLRLRRNFNMAEYYNDANTMYSKKLSQVAQGINAINMNISMYQG